MTLEADDWLRDVLVDLMMHLTRAGFPNASEMIADTLIVFETELTERRLAMREQPAEGPDFRVISGGAGQQYLQTVLVSTGKYGEGAGIQRVMFMPGFCEQFRSCWATVISRRRRSTRMCLTRAVGV